MLIKNLTEIGWYNFNISHILELATEEGMFMRKLILCVMLVLTLSFSIANTMNMLPTQICENDPDDPPEDYPFYTDTNYSFNS